MIWRVIGQSTQHSPLASEKTCADSYAFICMYTYATHMYHAHIHTHKQFVIHKGNTPVILAKGPRVDLSSFPSK